ncbi:Ankyrin repeat family protein [Rhynchospora pubera]|uniref:Ankyrin repeat family protein n=1 Tax=Rhynchospora pubera TaxID=906938 RepID=A0AAV8CVW2_9POAL|nr:Ankyrin repeat family protein [Rhynchospora pubera]
MSSQVPQNTEQNVQSDGGRTNQQARKNKWFEEMRGWIMVVAVLVASVTYSSGLNPPGGVWSADDLNGHKAGDAVLQNTSPARYTTFFYANATAFMVSLVIIILLMNEIYYNDSAKVVMLEISMVLGLVSLMVAYAAGAARKISTSIYIIVLAVGVLLFVVNSTQFMPTICKCVKEKAPAHMQQAVGENLIQLGAAGQGPVEKGAADKKGQSKVARCWNI